MGGILTLAQITLIVLKLLGTITWSWWWVLSPLIFGTLWAVGAVLAISGAASFMLLGLFLLFTSSKGKKKRTKLKDWS